MRIIVWSALLVCISFQMLAQTLKPDLLDLTKWKAVNRSVEAVYENGNNAVRFNEAPGDGQLVFEGIDFVNGIIELDIKGRNIMQQSFVGIAFHAKDEKTYESIYFRPFNFLNPDTLRRSHSVQYISMPDYPWEKLRTDFPGIYENKVNPVPAPDGWFHAKIVVEGKKVLVYVNNSQTPSLQVQKLTNTKKGGLAFWVGNNSGGSFANLVVTKK